uniref:Uncharacterized protein n=1 Tax=Glossina pallidipes TaxID=7398 RepID=A0A1B0A958_GLOPL
MIQKCQTPYKCTDLDSRQSPNSYGFLSIQGEKEAAELEKHLSTLKQESVCGRSCTGQSDSRTYGDDVKGVSILAASLKLYSNEIFLLFCYYVSHWYVLQNAIEGPKPEKTKPGNTLLPTKHNGRKEVRKEEETRKTTGRNIHYYEPSKNVKSICNISFITIILLLYSINFNSNKR